MTKTIGQMIAELEDDLEMCRKVDRYLAGWKVVFDNSSEKVKREMLREMLKTCGFTEEEAEKSLSTLHKQI